MSKDDPNNKDSPLACILEATMFAFVIVLLTILFIVLMSLKAQAG